MLFTLYEFLQIVSTAAALLTAYLTYRLLCNKSKK